MPVLRQRVQQAREFTMQGAHGRSVDAATQAYQQVLAAQLLVTMAKGLAQYAANAVAIHCAWHIASRDDQAEASAMRTVGQRIDLQMSACRSRTPLQHPLELSALQQARRARKPFCGTSVLRRRHGLLDSESRASLRA